MIKILLLLLCGLLISCTSGEEIVQMDVGQGLFIRKGTVIALLDDRDYRTQLSATQAEYNRIKSEADRTIEFYKKLSATPNDYDKAVCGLMQIPLTVLTENKVWIFDGEKVSSKNVAVVQIH